MVRGEEKSESDIVEVIRVFGEMLFDIPHGHFFDFYAHKYVKSARAECQKSVSPNTLLEVLTSGFLYVFYDM